MCDVVETPFESRMRKCRTAVTQHNAVYGANGKRRAVNEQQQRRRRLDHRAIVVAYRIAIRFMAAFRIRMSCKIAPEILSLS